MERYVLYIIPFLLIQTTVGETPDVPGLRLNVKNPKEYTNGDNIIVICSLTNSTPNAGDAILQWFDNKGIEITGIPPSFPHVLNVDSRTILMALGPAISGTTEGSYKCVATVNEVVYEKTLTIEVRDALSFTNCDEHQYGTLGFQSEINCQGSGNSIAYWSRNPPLTPDKYRKSSTKLIILKTEESDEGIYTYTAAYMDNDQSASMEIKFHVDVPPSILDPIQQTTAVVGKPATLYCNTKGKPDPVIEWKKAGSTNALETTDRITVNVQSDGDNVQGILTFLSVSKDDHAVYTCTAKNRASGKDVQPATSEMELEVQIPPTFEKVTGGKGKEGGPAALECITRGDPIPDMTWVNVKKGTRYTDGTTDKGVTARKEDLNKEPGNLGAKMTLSFKALKHSDAGEYKCEASNDAGEAFQVVNLEVEYSPNFIDQGEKIFYSWNGNQDSHITCTANGNPVPGFMWYKGDREITAGDNFHKVEQSDKDPDNPHRATSKLQVTYNGNNGDAVFGTYRCVAVNLIGSSEIVLQLNEARRPAEPMVDIRKKDVKKIEFWLYEPQTEGPEVSGFRVVYKVQGSSSDAISIPVEKEYRDHIDVTRKYTKIIVENLVPSTPYTFTFHAINPVGEGPGRELTITTRDISEPDVPEIVSQGNSPYPTRIVVKWKVPSDGGSTILEYRLTYQRVAVKTNQTYDGTKGYEVLSKISTVTTIDKIKDPPLPVNNLIPGEFYEIKVYAVNGKGTSLPGIKVIRTQEAPIAPGASSGLTGGLSTGAIIGIVIGIFFLLFIIVDVTCYLKNNCGILMTIKEKVGGGREEGYAVAKTEDVENLAKKDELTEEVKAAEEGEIAETQDDERKEPLLSEEQKVDTVDEGKTEKPELEPEEKEAVQTEQKIESPKPDQAPAEQTAKEIPAADEQPTADKPQE